MSTGFACRRADNAGQEIDISVGGDAEDFVERKYPNEVTQMTALNKRVVRMTFNPNVVGARDIAHKCYRSRLQSATTKASSDVNSGRQHVRHTAWIMVLSAILNIPVLVLAWAPLPPRPFAYTAASLVLATAVQFVVAGRLFISAFRALIFTHIIELDLLIVLRTSTAYIFSIVSFVYHVLDRPLPTGSSSKPAPCLSR